MNDHEQRLKEIKARVEKVTGGEWFCDHQNYILSKTEPQVVIGSAYSLDDDAAFIAHSKSDILFLLDLVEQGKHIAGENQKRLIDHNIELSAMVAQLKAIVERQREALQFMANQKDKAGNWAVELAKSTITALTDKEVGA